jgi:hypothetical protein
MSGVKSGSEGVLRRRLDEEAELLAGFEGGLGGELELEV